MVGLAVVAGAVVDDVMEGIRYDNGTILVVDGGADGA